MAVAAAVVARLPRLLGAVVLCAVAAGAGVLPATPSYAATTHTVEVMNRSGGSLHPADLEIHAGDTVAWTWVADEWHRMAVDTAGRSECVPNPLDPGHTCKGHTFEVTFDEVRTYEVEDEVTGSTGTVTVVPRPPAKPTPPSPTPSPPAEPSPSEPEPTEPSEAGPTPDPTSEGPTQPPAPDPPAPTGGTAAPPPVDTATTPDPTPTVGDPSVASSDVSPSPIPDPSFEAFPDPVDPTPVDDVAGDVALPTPDDGGGTARLLWGVVGGVTLLGTLGAFGRTVLFSEPWDV